MMTVYHGSFVEVKKPLVVLGRRNLDFGQGFYVTDIREQAVRWATRMAVRRMSSPILNVYYLDKEKVISSYNCLLFDAYNKAWLDFIVASRKGKDQWKAYDMIEGGVANDNVIDTVEDYIRGRMSAKAALEELSKHQPNNQICILNQEILNHHLHFKESRTC